MTPGPIISLPPERIYRVGRQGGVVHFSEIDALSAADDRSGNRFDTPGVNVMYCSTAAVGAYKEVLARFRPRAKDYAPLGDDEAWVMAAGSIPKQWRDGRRIAEIELIEPLPFLDVDQDRTMTYLTEQLAGRLDELGTQNLDTSVVRGPDRRVSRLIADWAYRATDGDGEPRFGGIRYSSRFASSECWAVFEGVGIGATTETPIRLDDVSFREAGADFGLTLH
ncbi:RES domain-containing protein [Microbacterium sp.]|uniref:RES domain-containing protein n=1 Tax=Microbacterium sp. TaxID=51671 RepID=UPI003F976F50